VLDYQANFPDLEWKMSKKEGGGKQQGGEKDVSGLYKELQTHKQNDEYEKAIKVGDHHSIQIVYNFVECPKNQNSTYFLNERLRFFTIIFICLFCEGNPN
jgi:hypothetical protein